MKLSKIITVISTLVGVGVALFVLLKFHPESMLRKEEPAAQQIKRISGKEEFESVITVDEITVTAKNVISTGVFRLKAWESPYQKTSRRGIRRKRTEVVKNYWDFMDIYNEYYLLECPDGTYILAQLPHSLVKEIKKTGNVTLPVGKKDALPQTAKSYLSDICNQYSASTKGVLYVFDDEWYKDHSFQILLIRFGVAIVALFAVAVCLNLLGDKVFLKKSQEE